MPNCPRCLKFFLTERGVQAHRAQPRSACPNNNYRYTLEVPCFLAESHDSVNVSSPPHSESPPPLNPPDLDFPFDPPSLPNDNSVQVEDARPFPAAQDPHLWVRDYFDGTSITYGKGDTFLRSFHRDQYSEEWKSNLYYPFASLKDWMMAKFLSKSRLSMALIDEYLSLDVTKDPVHFYYRDPLDCVKLLFNNPFFTDKMEYAPYKLYTSIERDARVYTEWISSDGAWELQKKIPVGATLCGVILSSDKMHITNICGGRIGYPLLISLANIKMDARNKAAAHGFLLLALLLIVKFVHDTPRMQSVLAAHLFHHCLDIILKPLKQAMERGVTMPDPLGDLRYCFTPITSYILDNPEALLVSVAILDAGLRKGKKRNLDHFYILKLELMQSIVPCITQAGCLLQWSADTTEHAHIEVVKEPASMTNHHDYDAQICRALDRDERCRLFDAAIHLQTAINDTTLDDDEDPDEDADSICPQDAQRRELQSGKLTLNSNANFAQQAISTAAAQMLRKNVTESRAYPDVSANGANYSVAINSEFELVFGTSCSSPMSAAISPQSTTPIWSAVQGDAFTYLATALIQFHKHTHITSKGTSLTDSSFRCSIRDVLIRSLLTYASSELHKIKQRQEDVLANVLTDWTRMFKSATSVSGEIEGQPVPQNDIAMLYSLISILYASLPLEHALQFWGATPAGEKRSVLAVWSTQVRDENMAMTLYDVSPWFYWFLQCRPININVFNSYPSRVLGFPCSESSHKPASLAFPHCIFLADLVLLPPHNRLIHLINNNPNMFLSAKVVLLAQSFLCLVSPFRPTPNSEPFQLAPLGIPLELKGTVFGALAAFCEPGAGVAGVDIYKGVWTLMERLR
ncbi:hypothetical protein OG21DRAFT_1486019 [Imleria badia]|nr:hypothetical protein OG21DRAFT_1486019 [Imleria badia]